MCPNVVVITYCSSCLQLSVKKYPRTTDELSHSPTHTHTPSLSLSHTHTHKTHTHTHTHTHTRIVHCMHTYALQDIQKSTQIYEKSHLCYTGANIDTNTHTYTHTHTHSLSLSHS